MKRSILIFVFTVLFAVTFFSGCTEDNNNGQIAKQPPEQTTFYVDDSGGKDYITIQEAIDEADSNDIVYVYSGYYYENVNITKSITLIGEDKNTTIIDASGEHDCFLILANSVTISGFTIQNAGNKGIYGSSGTHLTGHNGYLYFDSGIELYVNCKDVSISDNIISNTGYGIRLGYNCSNNTILNNILLKNMFGIYIHTSTNNIFSKNNIDSGDMNVYLLYSGYNIFSENVFEGTGGWHNIYLVSSGNNTFSNNIIRDSKDGVFLDCNGNDNNVFSYNIITNNSEYGILIRGKYFSSDEIIDYCDECINNLIEGNNISENGCGIRISSIDNMIYKNNFCSNNQNSNDTGSNIWYSNSLKQGNYYDDYTGVDNNGDDIGDDPYVIPGSGNQDFYPLMNPVDI